MQWAAENIIWLIAVAAVFFIVFLASVFVRNEAAKKEKPHEDDLHERHATGKRNDPRVP